jgi:putative hydrolase of the HAD superfamily
MRGFDHINTWVFDLDNTLYPASCRLFDQMHVRMADFIRQRFDVDEVEALRRRREYYLKYGTTLRGLMLEHDMEPADFLDYVHDIDYKAVKRHDQLSATLTQLPGRKLIFTNGTVEHAERVMQRLGVEKIFDGIFDIVASDYIPKPDRAPYEKFADHFTVETARAAMFEDIAQNLEAPYDMGMTTVLITSENQNAQPETDARAAAYVNYTTDDLAAFLSGVLKSIQGVPA